MSLLVPSLNLNLWNEGFGLWPRNSLLPLKCPVWGTGGPMWSPYQLLCPFQLHILELGVTTGWIQGPPELTVRRIWDQTPWTTWSLQVLTLGGEPQWHFGSPGINVSSEPVPSKLWKVDYFLFSHAVTLVKGYRSFGGRLGERWTA